MNWIAKIQRGNPSSQKSAKTEKVEKAKRLDAEVKLLAAKLQALHQVEIPFRDEEIQRLKQEVEILKLENETLKGLMLSKKVVQLLPKKA